MVTLQIRARVASDVSGCGDSAEEGIREHIFKEVELELGRNPKGREKKAAPDGRHCVCIKTQRSRCAEFGHK